MNHRLQRWLHLCAAGFCLTLLASTPVLAGATGPLELGTRLLEKRQPVLQWIQNDGFFIRGNAVSADLSFTDISVQVDGAQAGTRGHAAIMGGCFTAADDGTVRDDRYLLTIQTVNGKLRLLRTDPADGGGLLSAQDFGSCSLGNNPTSVNSTYFLDVAALDWNGDDYRDFAILYPGRQNNNSKKPYQYNLVLVDGKPDASGNLTCHHKDGWRWTLQSSWGDGGLAQGRIDAGDMDGDGKDEIVIFVGTQKKGSQDVLTLSVYDITKDLQLSATDEMTAYINYRNTPRSEKSCALDVAVGDFRGTGKLQIATLYSNFSPQMGFTLAQHAVVGGIWEVKNGSLQKVTDLGEVGKLPLNSNTGYLRCNAGDLDGDGMDELVWAGGDSNTFGGKVALVVHDPIYDESTGKLTFAKKAYGYPLNSNSGFPIFDLALGYFSEGSIPSDGDYPNKMGIGLAVRNGSQAIMKVVKWDGADALKESAELSFPVAWDRDTDYPVIVAADLTEESLALGTPLHFVVADQITPLMILQSPPRHRDIIDSVDYSCFCDESYCGQMKYYSTENRSAEESSNVSVSSALKEKASVGYKFFSLVDTKLEATFTQSKKKTEEELSEYSSTNDFSIEATVTNDDWLYYAEQDLEIWRYPILGQAGVPVSGDISTDELYYQVIYPTPTNSRSSGSGGHVSCTSAATLEWYTPVHENLNLLSYPTDKGLLADFPKDQGKIISASTSGNVGGSGAQTIQATMTETSAEQKTSTKDISNGSDVSFSTKGKCFGVSLEGAASREYDKATTESTVNGVNYSETKSFMVKMPSTGFAADETQYGFRLTPYVYLSKGKGTFVGAYTVDLYGGEGRLWNRPTGSPYWQAPDPALNLPQKWSKPRSGSWQIQQSEEIRKKIRGGFALQPDETGSFVDSTPETLLVMDNATGTIRLQCRVYNYSFVDCPSVDVKFSYIAVPTSADSHGRIIAGSPEDGVPVEIKTVSLNGIDARNDASANWQVASAEWDVSGLEDQGVYWIQVEIDPEGKLGEIHDTGDEIDNNIGWYKIALVRQETMNRLGNGYLAGTGGIASASKTTSVSDSDLEVTDFAMSDPDTGAEGTTFVSGVVVNTGDEPFGMVTVYFREYVDGSWNVFDAERIPLLRPGQGCNVKASFSPSSETSNVRMDVTAVSSEADFTNNSAVIFREDRSGGCSIAPFPVLILILPLLGLLKR